MYRFYVSSYAKGKEKGLYVCTLDETKNELHLNKHIPTEDFPSYVIKKDDYLVKGECGIDVTSVKDLKGMKYCKVTSANYNIFGSNQHIKVGGV